jgi:hypothetical protein
VLGRRVDVHHQLDGVHVDAAGGNVGGDQNPDLPVGEGLQVPLSGGLAEVAVQVHRGDAGGGQLLGELLGLVLGLGEQQPTPGPGGQVLHHGALGLRAVDGEHVVGHLGDLRLLGVHGLAQRVVQERLDDLVHPVVQGRGEQ